MLGPGGDSMPCFYYYEASGSNRADSGSPGSSGSDEATGRSSLTRSRDAAVAASIWSIIGSSAVSWKSGSVIPVGYPRRAQPTRSSSRRRAWLAMRSGRSVSVISSSVAAPHDPTTADTGERGRTATVTARAALGRPRRMAEPAPACLGQSGLDGLRVEVIQPERACHRPGAEIPEHHAPGDVRFVDEAVVPVRRPVAAEHEPVGIERIGIGEADFPGLGRIGELHDADPGLVVAGDEHVATTQRDDVVVVPGAVLGRGLRPRVHESAERGAGPGVEEEQAAVGDAAGPLAACLGATAGFVPEDQNPAVPGERGRVADRDPGDGDAVQDHRVGDGAAGGATEAQYGE